MMALKKKEVLKEEKEIGSNLIELGLEKKRNTIVSQSKSHSSLLKNRLKYL